MLPLPSPLPFSYRSDEWSTRNHNSIYPSIYLYVHPIAYPSFARPARPLCLSPSALFPKRLWEDGEALIGSSRGCCGFWDPLPCGPFFDFRRPFFIPPHSKRSIFRVNKNKKAEGTPLIDNGKSIKDAFLLAIEKSRILIFGWYSYMFQSIWFSRK